MNVFANECIYDEYVQMGLMFSVYWWPLLETLQSLEMPIETKMDKVKCKAKGQSVLQMFSV